MDDEDKKMERIEGEIFGGDNVIRVRGARQNNLQDWEIPGSLYHCKPNLPGDRYPSIFGARQGKSPWLYRWL